MCLCACVCGVTDCGVVEVGKTSSAAYTEHQCSWRNRNSLSSPPSQKLNSQNRLCSLVSDDSQSRTSLNSQLEKLLHYLSQKRHDNSQIIKKRESHNSWSLMALQIYIHKTAKVPIKNWTLYNCILSKVHMSLWTNILISFFLIKINI